MCLSLSTYTQHYSFTTLILQNMSSNSPRKSVNVHAETNFDNICIANDYNTFLADVIWVEVMEYFTNRGHVFV